MRAACLFLLILRALLAPVLAQTVDMVLESDPPGATVYVQGPPGLGGHRTRPLELGKTGPDPLPVDLAQVRLYLETKGGGRVVFLPLVLVREGYFDETALIRLEDLKPGYRHPKANLVPKQVAVAFHTDPPGATVVLEGIGTTVSGEQPFRFSPPRGRALTVRIEAPGYQPYQEVIQDNRVYREGRWPLAGERALTPTSWFVWLKNQSRKHPLVPILALALLLGAGLGIPSFLAERRRLRKLESLKAAADREDPLVLTKLGRWRIVEPLGAGGMATVYRALPDDSLAEAEAVAIKVMKKEICEDPEFRQRFLREVKVSKSLQHRNIVRVDDFGEQDGVLYLAMEYVPGLTLNKKLPRRGFEPEEARDYLEPILDALCYAHGRTVVHRDLKLENVMVTNSGRVVLMDFGLARSQDVSAVTRTGSALGTPAYMPPEQVLGAAPHPSADQYSLGVMIYELMTGRRPFEFEDPMQVVFAQVQKAPPPPREYRPDLPEAVERVILRALEKDPARRFPSLADLKRNLESAVAGGSVDEPPALPRLDDELPAAQPRETVVLPERDLAERDGGDDTLAFRRPDSE